MNSLFQGFINAIKAKIIPVWTKIKLYTSISYLKTELLRRLIQYFRTLTDVHPRDKNDYYGIFGWLVSKRLAFLIVILIGMLSAMYIMLIQPLSVFTASDNGIKTYSYDSIPLRFTEGKVRILAKSKYVAYEGEVKEGLAHGMGILYRKDGSMVYEGQFENSEFHGTGTSYFPSEQVQYVGQFEHNVYCGEGKLYRENGTIEYVGDFLDGKKEGEGTLYDTGSNPIYTGNFTKDQLVYMDFLGKSTAEANAIYTGETTVYTDDEYFVVDMEDIDAVYYGMQGEENLRDEVIVEGIYVLKDSFDYNGSQLTRISEIRQMMGEAIYEGNTYATMPENVMIHIMNQKGNSFSGDIGGEWEQYLSDAVHVNNYDTEYTMYIYTFVQEDVRYTFFCNDKSGEFLAYLMEKN